MKTEIGEKGIQTRLFYPTLTYAQLLPECQHKPCLPRLRDGHVPSKETACLTQYNLRQPWSDQLVDSYYIGANFWCSACFEKLTGEKFA